MPDTVIFFVPKEVETIIYFFPWGSDLNFQLTDKNGFSLNHVSGVWRGCSLWYSGNSNILHFSSVSLTEKWKYHF